MEKIIPLEIETMDVGSSEDRVVQTEILIKTIRKKFYPDVKEPFILIVKGKYLRPQDFVVEFMYCTNNTELIIKPEYVYHMVDCKNITLHCISSPSQNVHFNVFHNDLLIKDFNRKEEYCEILVSGRSLDEILDGVYFVDNPEEYQEMIGYR